MHLDALMSVLPGIGRTAILDAYVTSAREDQRRLAAHPPRCVGALLDSRVALSGRAVAEVIVFDVDALASNARISGPANPRFDVADSPTWRLHSNPLRLLATGRAKHSMALIASPRRLFVQHGLIDHILGGELGWPFPPALSSGRWPSGSLHGGALLPSSAGFATSRRSDQLTRAGRPYASHRAGMEGHALSSSRLSGSMSSPASLSHGHVFSAALMLRSQPAPHSLTTPIARAITLIGTSSRRDEAFHAQSASPR